MFKCVKIAVERRCDIMTVKFTLSSRCLLLCCFEEIRKDEIGRRVTRSEA